MISSGALQGRLTPRQAAMIGHPELGGYAGFTSTPTAGGPMPPGVGFGPAPTPYPSIPIAAEVPRWEDIQQGPVNGAPIPYASGSPVPARTTGLGGALVGIGTSYLMGLGKRTLSGWKDRLLGYRSRGGEMAGVIGDNQPLPPGYPLMAHKEDMREQTFAPDLWCRRVNAGLAVPAGAIKKGYQVPLIDADGDLEGWVRADKAIPARCLIIYPHKDSTVTAELVLGVTKRPRVIGYVTVRDYEGSDYAGMATVIAPPKRRRGGVHITAKELSAAKKAAGKIARLHKAHTAASILPRRRKKT
jgi:hypothetical protein